MDFLLLEETVIPKRVYPVGSYVSETVDVRKKGIAAAVEYLLVAGFTQCKFVTQDKDANVSDMRRSQLRRYGIKNRETLPNYLQKLKRALSSPHFRIVKFPSWITDPEILQLGDKV